MMQELKKITKSLPGVFVKIEPVVTSKNLSIGGKPVRSEAL